MCNLPKRIKTWMLFVVLLSVVDFANKLIAKRVRRALFFIIF